MRRVFRPPLMSQTCGRCTWSYVERCKSLDQDGPPETFVNISLTFSLSVLLKKLYKGTDKIIGYNPTNQNTHIFCVYFTLLMKL